MVDRQTKIVAYHLGIARAADPTLERDHIAARVAHPAPRDTAVVEALINYVCDTGTFPSMKDPVPAVRQLGRWLYNRRRECGQGVLPDKYRARLEVLPGWDGPGGKKIKEDQQWKAKLETVVACLQAGND